MIKRRGSQDEPGELLTGEVVDVTITVAETVALAEAVEEETAELFGFPPNKRLVNLFQPSWIHPG